MMLMKKSFFKCIVLMLILCMYLPVTVFANDVEQEINTDSVNDITENVSLIEDMTELFNISNESMTMVNCEQDKDNQNVTANGVVDDTVTIENELKNIRSNTYPDGCNWDPLNRGFAGGLQCFGFAKKIQNLLFGNIPQVNGYSTAGANLKLVAETSDKSANSIRNLLSHAQAGDWIQGSTPNQHSMIFCWQGGDQFAIYDANGVGGYNIVSMRNLNYNAFASKSWSKVCLFRNTAYPQKEIDTIPPKITNLQFTDINAEGFTVICNVEDDVSGIKQVDFPIWTEINGQDEVVWYPGTIDGNKATCRVNFSEHNNEKGYYRVNVWAYDKKGLCSKLEGGGIDINLEIDITPPKITNLQFTDINTEGFTVTCNVEDDASEIKQVDFPIWTEINGQDEVVWYPGTIDGNKATCRVNFSEHNDEKGYYRVNVWAYDKKGLCSKLEGGGIDINTSSSVIINSFETSETSGQEINTSISLMAQVTGGTAPYQYKFYTILDNTTIGIQNFSSKNTATFKPTVPGIYTLYVEIKDAAGKTASRSIEKYIIQEVATEPVNNVVCAYRTHVQNEGWQAFKYNGDMSGTSGKSYRLEGIEINLENQGYDLGVVYSTHVENIGWQDIRSNGAMSGTSGKALRLEAIKINLTGADADKFNIYYQVHAQNFGWLDWAKNGESSGTEGFGYRLEGIRIKIVPKDDQAPGSTTKPFVQK